MRRPKEQKKDRREEINRDQVNNDVNKVEELKGLIVRSLTADQQGLIIGDYESRYGQDADSVLFEKSLPSKNKQIFTALKSKLIAEVNSSDLKENFHSCKVHSVVKVVD